MINMWASSIPVRSVDFQSTKLDIASTRSPYSSCNKGIDDIESVDHDPSSSEETSRKQFIAARCIGLKSFFPYNHKLAN
jgi:hypothetical protein